MTEIEEKQDSMENDKDKIQELKTQDLRIQKIIEKRRKQAIKKQLSEKINQVVKILGDQSDDRYFKYQDTTFKLIGESKYYQVDLTKNNIDPDYVFRGRHENEINRIDLYIPGEWEDHLESLYQKALITEKQQEITRLKKNLADKIKEWNIKEEEINSDKIHGYVQFRHEELTPLGVETEKIEGREAIHH